ncbi:triose-phosphate isomerase [Clostridium intestinale]|uniref:Triose-phosphate isomerase n=1 Tax=Clostridium intestinale TaxID=36845 RepID=A0A7D7A4X0_9CLOT|nr:triose-phosphate isomerase [Clostridium intestinale]QLY80700.1 triose-phosphate isomerase [Clostridium intestinale]
MKIRTPFLVVNPKSYLYGKRSLDLALAADKIAKETSIEMFFTCPFADIRYISENTTNVIVTAQHMESLKPGRGMGHVLPESLKEAGAKAVFLNHAENPMTVAELSKTIERARELDIKTIVCADSVSEAVALSKFNPDIILAEPTELIGTGKTADNSYVIETTEKIREMSPNTLVMIASGVTTAEDVYNVIKLGADGTGGTNGILGAPDPKKRIEEWAEAMVRAIKDKE